jgi:hypothetical protein
MGGILLMVLFFHRASNGIIALINHHIWAHLIQVTPAAARPQEPAL